MAFISCSKSSNQSWDISIKFQLLRSKELLLSGQGPYELFVKVESLRLAGIKLPWKIVEMLSAQKVSFMKNPKNGFYRKQITITYLFIILAFCIPRQLLAKEESSDFFTKNKHKLFYVDIDGVGEKISLEHWDNTHYYANILQLFQSKELLLSDKGPYDLLAKVESLRLLGMKLPFKIVEMLCVMAFGHKLEYVGVTILEETSQKTRIKVHWLDENRQVFKELTGSFIALE